MNIYNAIMIHPFSSSIQEERLLLSCNGQFYEAGFAVVEPVETLQQYRCAPQARQEGTCFASVCEFRPLYASFVDK